jgi:hypothetical protein
MSTIPNMATSMRYLVLLLWLLMSYPSPLYAQMRPAAPPVDIQAAPGHPGWSVDSRMGCWVWNGQPALNETVTWSGSCDSDGPS